jgi:small-conductance mechanosensitive channel
MRSTCKKAAARLVLMVAVIQVFFTALQPAHAALRRAHDRVNLFQRRPFDFNRGTLERLEHWAAALPHQLSQLSLRVLGEPELLAGAVVAAVLLLAVTIWSTSGRRRVERWIGKKLAGPVSHVPGALGQWFSALGYVAASVSLPLVLWALYSFGAGISGYTNPVFLIVGDLLSAWTFYALAVSTIHELVRRPLLNVPKEYGRYLYRFPRALLLYWLVVSVLLNGAPDFGVPRDVVALFRTVFRFSLIALLGIFFSHRRAIMALFPQIPNRMYQRFVNGLDRIYPLVLALTVTTALLHWAGFRHLADFVWLRTWALAGLFVATVLIHHLLCLGLRQWILRAQPVADSAISFYRSAVRLLDYFGALVVMLIALRLTGLSGPLHAILSQRFASIGDQPLSALVIVEAAVIVAGFIFFATLLRDYLAFRVYPALNVDPGVAHAIDTFLVYTLAIIGFLSALEAVGLGLGTIALFAGALGIGAGFGLQSITNNLASGLTLIFSRALRRGDWVTVGETIGLVQEVGIRATRLRTRDDVEYLIPNSEFVAGKIVNWTRSSPYARLHVPVGVSYGADPQRVREILENVARRTPNVQPFPTPEVWFMGFGDSSLNFELLVWLNVREIARQQLASDLYFAIFSAFKESEIEIPFPQRDLHIRSADGLARLGARAV